MRIDNDSDLGLNPWLYHTTIWLHWNLFFWPGLRKLRLQGEIRMEPTVFFLLEKRKGMISTIDFRQTLIWMFLIFIQLKFLLSMVDRPSRKRTSIAAPEKRSLEAYFAVQPRPSGEKIAAIAEKLDLKKNVVRVWFCNQRQKQKRMKFAAQGGIH